MKRHPFVRRARLQLLGGIPAVLLLLPGTAFAQSGTLATDGRSTITNDQRGDGAVVQGVLVGTPATIAVTTLSDAQARLAGNALSANARTNDAEADLTGDLEPTSPWPVHVTIDGAAVAADADSLIASRQTLRRASAFAETLTSPFAIRIGTASASQALLEDNLTTASSRGNNHVASLAGDNGSGTSIVSVQSADAGSQVLSKLGGTSYLSVDDADRSVLRLDRNRQQAVASGNSATLAVDTAGPVLATGAGAATMVEPGRTSVSAGSATVTNQYWADATGARIGLVDSPGGFASLAGTLTGTTFSTDANVLVAAATANQALTGHATDAAILDGRGTAATSLTVQDAEGIVSSGIAGRIVSNVLGPVERSTVSVSGNDVAASATGNAADTSLTGHAGIVPVPVEGGMPTPASAWVSPDRLSGTTGTYTVHTDQNAGEMGISAVITRSSSLIGLQGSAVSSSILANGNRQAADAVANDGSSLLDLDATDFAGSAAVSLVQSSNADAASLVGDADDVGGATIAPVGPVQDSRLQIRDNVIEAQSSGNRGANVLRFTAADLSASLPSRVGAIEQGFGASASAVLTSNQKVGELGTVPAIRSEIAGRFSVTGDGPTQGSTLDIRGNRSAAQAVANTTDNRLTLSAATLDGAGAALFSSQYGEAAVRAISTVRFVSHGALESSPSTIAGNSNLAIATMNDAANRVAVDAADADMSGPATLSADMLGGATGEAPNLLVNGQFATGGVLAQAATTVAGSAGATNLGASGPTDSRFEVSSNVTAAQASGNQALNDAAFDGVRGGLVTSQMSIASVTAAASSAGVMTVPLPGRSILGSDLSVSANSTSALARGNVAENSLTAPDRFDPTMPASVEVDRFEARVEAPIALLNAQSSYGTVTALVEGPVADYPLNHNGVPMTASRITVSGNTLSATAYGNGAVNTIGSHGAGMPAALVSTQSNYGQVTARAFAPVVTISPGDVARSTIGVVDNRVTASATGNLATSIVGTPR